MKIYIHEPNETKTIRLNIPNALLLNRLSLYLGTSSINNYFPDLSYSQISKIAKVLKKSVHQFGHFELVHIESKDGEIIHIEL